jgi:hypothetical protein
VRRHDPLGRLEEGDLPLEREVFQLHPREPEAPEDAPHLVLEFFSPAYVNVCYWALSCQVRAEYRYLVGEGEAPPAFVDPHLGHADILLDPDKLSRALVSAGCEAPARGRRP